MTVKTIEAHISDLKYTRDDVAKKLSALGQKAADEGRAMDEAEVEEFNDLEAQIKTLDDDISRQERIALLAKNAKPVEGEAKANAERPVNVTTRLSVTVKNTEKLDPGIAFARAAKCLALGHLEHRDAIQIAKNMYGDQESVVRTTQRLVTKAAVPPATTTDPTWAEPLIGADPIADFIEFLRPQTILGKFGQGGVPALRNIGFRLPVVGQTSGGDGYWVGETQAKPLTKFDFAGTSLEPLKVANIAVASMEVIRDSRPAADMVIRDQLAAALRERLDLDFINPAKAALAGVSPASILNGVAGIPSSGTDADAVRRDIAALFGSFIAARNAPTAGVLILNSVTALALSLMQNPLGQAEFPGIGMTGGTFLGLPTIVSDYVPTGIVAMVNASDIYLGDEGGIDVSMATEASLQMENSPDNPTTASTVLVSLWQNNLVGFRAERTINWARRRESAVAYLTGVDWGAPDAPTPPGD